MKKLVLVLGLMSLLVATSFAINNLKVCTVQTSTGTANNIPTTVGIDKATVRIKSLSINQFGTTAQTVKVFQDVTSSTTTATQIAQWSIPGTVGIYNVVAPVLLSDEGNYWNVPGFTVTTSTSTNPVDVTVMYW